MVVLVLSGFSGVGYVPNAKWAGTFYADFGYFSGQAIIPSNSKEFDSVTCYSICLILCQVDLLLT